MPTIEVMPMTTPRTVSAERILFVRRVSIDMPTISLSRPARIPATLLAPQCFDRVERRGTHRRVQSEEQPDNRRDANADGDGPQLDGGRQRGRFADGERQQESQTDSDETAEGRERHRFGED